MDFTFFAAAFISFVVGIAFGIWNVGSNPWKRLSIALLTSICLDFALLIDWSAVDASIVPLLLFDLLIFSVYGLVGCAIGLGIGSILRDIFMKLLRRD